jgi:hypothetical protein
VTWSVEEIDVERRTELQRSRIEVLAGADAGVVHEELHRVTSWTPAAWAEAVAESPFELVACYDGDEARRPRRPISEPGRLLWHELALAGDAASQSERPAIAGRPNTPERC